MIIPLGTERASNARPVVTAILIAMNVTVFAVMISLANSRAASLDEGAREILQQYEFLGVQHSQWWRWITYAFLHSPSDWFHIAGNMLFLWVFGPTVEEKMGHIGFSVLYLLGAVVSAWSHSLASPFPLIGASGAIAALGGAFIVLAPLAPFRVLVLFFYAGVYTVPAYWVIGFALARDFIGLGMPSSVSNAGHLGGYGLGIASTLLLLATGVLKREKRYDLLSIFLHRQRLQAFKAASAINQEREKRILANNDPKSKGKLFGKGEPSNPDAEAIAVARASVSTELSKHDLIAACSAYKDMLARFPAGGTAIILSRQNQLAIGNALFQAQEYSAALPAYRHFIVMYPRDQQAAHVRLMIGLIRTRYDKEPVEARKEIAAALPSLTDPDEASLARTLLEELGPAPQPPAA